MAGCQIDWLSILTPSKLATYVNLNNQIESNNEKETKKAKQSKNENVEQDILGLNDPRIDVDVDVE